jgi:hypothetical protein
MSVKIYYITVVEHEHARQDVRGQLQVDYEHRQTLIRTHTAKEQCLSHLVRYVQLEHLQREQRCREQEQQVRREQEQQIQREQEHKLQREQEHQRQCEQEHQRQCDLYFQDLQYELQRPRKINGVRNGDYRRSEWLEEKWAWNPVNEHSYKRKLSEMNE